MSKIRVLIIDDSVVIRRSLSSYLSTDPEIEVAGTAADGQIGLAKIAQLNPDLVVLDLEMPVLDGLQTLAAIRKENRTLPVIVFSTLTERGAVATLNALSLGASDYVTKTAGAGSKQNICEELVLKVKTLCARLLTAVPAPSPRVERRTAARPSAKPGGATPIELVAIGASTGGPNALATLVAALGQRLPVPVVIVQHMPPMFTRLLAERLASLSGLPVHEGQHGAPLRPGEIWVAPGGYHMAVVADSDEVRLQINEEPPENSCRPAVDVLFRSVASVYGPRALGVILTGMGQDGLVGCQKICERGGRVLAQDEATSVVWGMPGAVHRAGLADKTLALPEMGPEINRILAARPQPSPGPSVEKSGKLPIFAEVA